MDHNNYLIINNHNDVWSSVKNMVHGNQLHRGLYMWTAAFQDIHKLVTIQSNNDGFALKCVHLLQNQNKKIK